MKTQRTTTPVIIMSTDYFTIGYVYILIIISFLFAQRIPGWQEYLVTLMAYGSAFVLLSWLTRRIRHESGAFILRVCFILILFSYLFQAAGPLQHIIHKGWFDEMLISWEVAITGTEFSIFLQRITSPVLTEWMMFAYVFYVPLLPLVAFACYKYSGRQAGEFYLLNIVTVFALCFCGFILLPVMTPLFYMPEVYSVSLDGWLFAGAGEWIRETQHFPGGALPSPHTAASTVMLIFTYRYARKHTWWVFPIVFTIYFATVYGRYHYIWDSLTGIITGLLTVRLTPRLIELMSAYIIPSENPVTNLTLSSRAATNNQIPNTQEV